MRPSVSVLVCAYTDRRFGMLKTAVTAVLEQITDRDELVLVVDHNEQLEEAVKATFAGRARVLSNTLQRGLSGARNTGVAAARGEVIAFLDDDAVPEPGWLEDLVGAFSDETVIATGGTATPAWEHERPDWFPDEFLWVVGCSYRGLPERPAEIRNPIGANMAFRREVIQRVGGFTDGIGRLGHTPLGCEETELAIRAANATGGRILLEPAASVRHLVTRERARPHYFFHRCWAEGISKAVVAKLVGSGAALDSERTYVRRTLAAGILAGVRDGARGDASGFARAAAIAGGLLVTVLGYARGSVTRGVKPAAAPATVNGGRAQGSTATFTPIWSGELELTQPSLPERFIGSIGEPMARVRLLVREAGTPLGFIELDAPDGTLSLNAAVAAARQRFAREATNAEADRAWTVATGPKISVVLCTHNRGEGARRTLESLAGLRYENIEVIVVDNAPSDDATARVVDELAARDPRVRYVMEPRKGLSRARNRGLAEATGDIVAFTDDDVHVDSLWLHGVLRGFERRPDVACVTGLVATTSLEYPTEQYFDRRVWWSSSCEQRLYTPHRGPRDSVLHPYSAGIFGAGANFAARTDVLRSLGGFDVCLGAGSPTRGGEDLDFFLRVLRAGHSLSFEPSALVWHDHRVDDAALREQMYGYGVGLTAYLTKHAIARDTRTEILMRGLYGLAHLAALSKRSGDAEDETGLGAGMRGVELRGMLAGPFAYVRARRRA